MSNIRITKHFNFEAAHALYGYDGKCKNIHGHSYQLFVTVIGKPIKDSEHIKNGMVMDFGDLKKIVNKEIVADFDHATVLNNQSPHRDLATILTSNAHKIVLVEYQPTSENMLIDFAERIKKHLPKNVNLHNLKLYETADSYAEWFASDNS
ncbi:MAG: 6-carboxytetrahydropterin synthase [Flavobacteriales bacterium]|jgi:6-pyruvoyltetrahydropterin/6-carboxytetrahydropterin synthase|nr:6-carboxytetrahydropterin synthase [Flavobacteriales bacterium]